MPENCYCDGCGQASLCTLILMPDDTYMCVDCYEARDVFPNHVRDAEQEAWLFVVRIRDMLRQAEDEHAEIVQKRHQTRAKRRPTKALR
jgi:hypothetical protein